MRRGIVASFMNSWGQLFYFVSSTLCLLLCKHRRNFTLRLLLAELLPGRRAVIAIR